MARGGAPFTVLACLDRAGQVEHHQVNPAPGGTWSSMPLPLPQNATECLSVAIGHHAKLGRGVYSLFQLGVRRSLVFSTVPKIVSGRTVVEAVDLDLPGDFTASTVTALATADGSTDLYVGGNGVYRYSAASQRTSHLVPERLIGGDRFAAVRDLVVAADQEHGQIGLWAIDAGDALIYVEGTTDGQKGYAWQHPLQLENEVTALAAYRARTDPENGRSAAAMAVGGSDGGFRLLVKDPQAGLWQHQSVSLHTTSEFVTLQTYTTRVVVTDAGGNPLVRQEITVTPDHDRAALLNGRYYALRASTAKTATTDSNGVLTIVAETADLTAPVYTFEVAGEDPVTVDPAEETKAALRGLTGDSVGSATRSDGKPLFATRPDAKTCDKAATAVGQLMTAHDQLASGEQRQLVGTFAAQGVGDWLEVGAGDLLAALRGDPTGLRDFVLHPPSELVQAWQLVVQVGDYLWSCVLTAAHEAVAAIDWVLRNTLGITLEDLVAWLGFLFSWEDMLANHRVLAKVVSLSFDQTALELAGAKTTIDDLFGKVREQFVDGALVVDTSADVFASRAGRRDAPASEEHKAALNKPQANWGQHQFSTNVDSAQPGEFVPKDVGSVLSTAGAEEIAIFRQTGAQLSALFGDGLADRTPRELVTAIAEIVGLALVDTLENAVLTVVDAGIVLIETMKSILTTRWDIPVLTPLYEQVICGGDGSELTLLDVFCLLGAIPSTLVGKVVLGHNLFTDRQVSAVAEARTWNDLLHALSTPDRGARAARVASANETAAGVLQLVNGFLRIANNALGAAADFREAPDPVRIAKLGVEVTGFAVGLIGTGLLVPSSGVTTRQRLDIAIATMGFIPPVLNCVHEYLRAASKTPGHSLYEIELDPPQFEDDFSVAAFDFSKIGLSELLRYFECVYGITLLGMSFASLCLQAPEDPPDGGDKVTHVMLTELKAGQNFCAAGAAIAAPLLAYPLAAEPDERALGQLVRLTLQSIRADIQIGRSIAQLVDGIVDFEGAIP
ncbi:Ig-like domain-containing protein [Lentzea sp.]|uniref:Ig-like domain-containing protein n=1 Tax=Lentzea sp. TaxID=56099 RepID=UPI002ED54C43